VSTEWYAVYYRLGKRTLSKIGNYPTMSLADARKKFREEYAPAISAGAEPASKLARTEAAKRGGTVKELFEAYVASLKHRGKRSYEAAERVLLGTVDGVAFDVRKAKAGGVANVLGPDVPASAVTPGDLAPYLKEIHGRGCRGVTSSDAGRRARDRRRHPHARRRRKRHDQGRDRRRGRRGPQLERLIP
jgi:hypothetical protein